MNNKRLPTFNKVFTEAYGGSVNFMTPKVIEKAWLIKDCPGLVYELSSGKGIFSDIIYGVTIVEFTKNRKSEKRHYWCECFHSMDEVKTHLKKVKSEFKNGRV